MDMAAVILGISPGVKHSGMVILSHGELVDHKIRLMQGDSPENKLSGFRIWIENCIEKYQVDAIAMKIVPSWHYTEALEALYSELKRIATDTGIFLSTFPMERLRELLPGQRQNKIDLFRHVIGEFPELGIRYHRAMEDGNRYYAKFFEALSCAYAHLQLE